MENIKVKVLGYSLLSTAPYNLSSMWCMCVGALVMQVYKSSQKQHGDGDRKSLNLQIFSIFVSVMLP